MNAPEWKVALASQYGAALDMLENAIRACPDEVWEDPELPVAQQFWYIAFHTLWWHDHYLAASESAHLPPEPFTLDEMDPAGKYPAAAYTREELLAFLDHGHDRCRARFGGLTEVQAAEPCGFERRNMSLLELFLYNLRHLQHHGGQLHLLLRQGTDSAPSWVSRGRRA